VTSKLLPRFRPFLSADVWTGLHHIRLTVGVHSCVADVAGLSTAQMPVGYIAFTRGLMLQISTLCYSNGTDNYIRPMLVDRTLLFRCEKLSGGGA